MSETSYVFCRVMRMHTYTHALLVAWNGRITHGPNQKAGGLDVGSESLGVRTAYLTIGAGGKAASLRRPRAVYSSATRVCSICTAASISPRSQAEMTTSMAAAWLGGRAVE